MSAPPGLGFMKVGLFPRWFARNFSSKVLSVAWHMRGQIVKWFKYNCELASGMMVEGSGTIALWAVGTFGKSDSSSKMLSTPMGRSNMSMQFWAVSGLEP